MVQKYIYPIVVYYETKNDGEKPIWIGNFPGINGCWVEGDTKDEVIEKAPHILHEFASTCREYGLPLTVPPPVSELESANVGDVYVIEEFIPETETNQ